MENYTLEQLDKLYAETCEKIRTENDANGRKALESVLGRINERRNLLRDEGDCAMNFMKRKPVGENVMKMKVVK